jgi:hypothetical protein
MTKASRVLFIILWVFLESCNTDFNINAPHQDVYALNCILRNDTSIQYATISKNYFTESGAAPPSNTIESNIKGVTIQIFSNDSAFAMRDTTVELTESGTSVQVGCYYLRNLVLNPGKPVSIEAALPDGQILKSTKQIPVCYIDLSYFSFPQSYYTKARELTYVKFPTYSWIFRMDNEWVTDIASSAQFAIEYEINEGGTHVNKEAIVPLTSGFLTDNSGIILSPDLSLSFNYTASTTLETVDRTMQEISGSDPFKNNYIITKAVFTITSLDPELTKYYYAYEVWRNSSTIKLRPTDYTNIEGGKGVFGIYYKYSNSLVVDKDYVSSFGYQYDPSGN